MALPNLSQLLDLPEALTDSERSLCISIANNYGVEAAAEQAATFVLRQSFLKDYIPSNAMPDRDRILQAIPHSTTAINWHAEEPKQIEIELEEAITVNQLGTIFNMLQPNEICTSDSLTILDLDWN